MGNCLVTQLKSRVDASLPTLNKLILDYIAPVTTSTNDILRVYINTGSTAPTIKFKKTCQITDGGSDVILANTDYQLQTNHNYEISVYEIPLDDIENFIEITNYYDLKRLAIKDRDTDAWSICSGNLNDRKSGLESLYRMAPVDFVSVHAPEGIEGYKFNTTLQKVALDFYGSMEGTIFNVDNIVSLPNLQHLEVKAANTYNAQIRLTDTFVNSNIYYLSAWCVGNISSLPNKLEFLNARGNITGTIEGLVEKFRRAGRESGSLWIIWATNSGITYNGVTLATLWDNNQLPKDGRSTYLVWTADSIEFTGTKPAALSKYNDNSTGTWTPYV